MLRQIPFIIISVLCVLPLLALAAPVSPENRSFFEGKVRPLLSMRCFACHSKDAEANGKLKAGLKMDSLAGLLKGGDTGSALVPGDLEASAIIEAVHYKNEDMAMPPKGKLSDTEIGILSEWVRRGAPWPGVDPSTLANLDADEEPYDWDRFRREHWSFQPIIAHPLPRVQMIDWPQGEIDQFVLARLETEQMQPNPTASKRMLIRRAYLDLIGLPPTTAQVRAFLVDDSPNAFTKVIDTLLESQHYGERWARHWMDVARYSDGLGGFGDGGPLPNAWRYRDWLVNALNEDMPYDQLVMAQIAGDLLEDPDPLGTGFFAVGPTYRSDGGDPEAVAQAEAETLSDRVDTFSRAFLGLTAACARCHDHKFDPISIKDYYSLAGIFRNSRFGEHPVSPKAIVDAYHAGQKAIRDQSAHIRRWLDEEGKTINEKNHNKIQNQLSEAKTTELQKLRDEETRLKKAAPKKFEFAHVLAESGDKDMHVALRGDLRKRGDLVQRRFVTILAGSDAPAYEEGSGRLELAQSVIDPSNPLTARVMVNRVWQWHFGKALVRTPSNFGVLGEEPTHPLLLDWLANDFINNGWSLKRLHRQILSSATWQMSSSFNQQRFDRDGDNRLLWRANPRKLMAETWRDTVLAVTGELDSSVGGPPAHEILDSKRRTIYGTVSRNGDRLVSDEFLRLFDFPAPRSTSAERAVSTVPQQYLFMMNSPFMKTRSEALGSELAKQTLSIENRIRAIYERLYSREVETLEIQLGMHWVNEATDSEEAWTNYAQVLLSTHELFQIQ